MMFDNLRELSDGDGIEGVETVYSEAVRREMPETRIWGLTSGQRLVLAVLLLATVFILGSTCLLVTQKIWL
jgi:hypothetical protein